MHLFLFLSFLIITSPLPLNAQAACEDKCVATSLSYEDGDPDNSDTSQYPIERKEVTSCPNAHALSFSPSGKSLDERMAEYECLSNALLESQAETQDALKRHADFIEFLAPYFNSHP